MAQHDHPALVAYINADVFLPTGMVSGHAVVTSGKTIVSVVPRDEVPVEAGLIDFPGKTILPGLIDIHTHPSDHAQLDRSTALDAGMLSVRNALRFLRAGVTTVRALGGAGRADAVLGRLTAAGIVPGPRVISSGYALGMTGGHCSRSGREVDGVDDVRKAVREELRDGNRWIKLMCSGGFEHPGEMPTAVQFSPEEVAAAVAEADRAGVRVAAHAHNPRAITMAAKAGVASIEHGSFLDRDAARAMVDNDVFLVPTFAIYDNFGSRSAHPTNAQSRALGAIKQRSFALALEEGVRWAVGSDAQGGSPLELTQDEIIIMVDEVGLPAEEVLRQATSGNAELLGLTSVGAIAPGFEADLVVVDGNPLSRISDIARVVATVKAGKVYDWNLLAPALNLWTLDMLDVPADAVERVSPSRLWDQVLVP